jgi:hypothetical protein
MFFTCVYKTARAWQFVINWLGGRNRVSVKTIVMVNHRVFNSIEMWLDDSRIPTSTTTPHPPPNRKTNVLTALAVCSSYMTLVVCCRVTCPDWICSGSTIYSSFQTSPTLSGMAVHNYCNGCWQAALCDILNNAVFVKNQIKIRIFYSAYSALLQLGGSKCWEKSVFLVHGRQLTTMGRSHTAASHSGTLPQQQVTTKRRWAPTAGARTCDVLHSL